MIVLRLNGADISLTRAFIPLWVVDGILLIGILAVLCINLRDDWDYADCSDLFARCGFALFAICVVAMLPLFKGLLAAVDAGTLAMSMRMLCIPLFIFFGLACMGLTVVALLVGMNHSDD
jgi:hypothetical protein